MSLDNIPTNNVSTRIAGACEPVLKPYHAPRLTVFGSVTTLTETGSRDGMEDGWQNGWCSNWIAPINTTYDMC
jgi:hypothetical protein